MTLIMIKFSFSRLCQIENMTDSPGQLSLPILLGLFHEIDARLHEIDGKVFLRRNFPYHPLGTLLGRT